MQVFLTAAFGRSVEVVGDDNESRPHQQEQHDHANHKQKRDSAAATRLKTGMKTQNPNSFIDVEIAASNFGRLPTPRVVLGTNVVF